MSTVSDADRPPRPAAPEGTAATDVNEARRELIAWFWRLPVVLAVGGGAFGLYEAIRIHFEKDAPAKHPVFAPRPHFDVGPVSAFAAVWDSIPFELPGAHPIPAIVLRLPGPIPGGLDLDVGGATAHLAGFSRVCTHMGCTVNLNTDLKAIQFAFNYHANHPELTCHCHLSIFDPTHSGEAVSGPAVRPLPRLQLIAQAGRIVATGLERT